MDGDEYIVYIGSGQVKTRLLDHLNKKEFPMGNNTVLNTASTETECRIREQQLLQAFENAHGKLPMYNVDSK